MTLNIHPDADRWGGWHWEQPRRGEHFRRCSYCGSVHPDDLAAEPAWEPQWSDMKYGWPHKFYVPIPNRDPDQLYVISAGHKQYDPSYVRADQLTEQQRAVAERDGWLREREAPWEYFQFGTHADHFGKFYTIHLADEAISAETCEDIERRSGLAFDFDVDGGTVTRIYWRMAVPPADEPPPHS